MLKRGFYLLVVIVGFLLVWQLVVNLFAIPDYVLPDPVTIMRTFIATFALQMINLGVTAYATLVGLALSLVIGIVMALAIVFVRPLQSVFMPMLAAFNGIPKIAIAPLLVAWFGLGIEAKILLAMLLSLFPIFVNALSGMLELDKDLLDMARLAGGNRFKLFYKLRLPHALPYITDALKVAFPLALAGAIVGEFIGANKGIGYLVLSGQFNLDMPLVFAALFSITLFTTTGIWLIGMFEHFFLAWQPSRRH